VIEEIVPGCVCAREAFEDPGGGGHELLYPEEAEVIARSVPKRQREFTTVRLCARGALEELGYPPQPLLPGRRGAPGWPEGVVGSMTHCAGYRAAVVARARDVVSAGIDAEPNEPLPDGVLKSISLPVERKRLAALRAGAPRVWWDRLLFSAKESVFKTWYPLTGSELGFEEAEIEPDPDAGTFSARLLVPGPMVEGRRVEVFSGRWLTRNGLVVTAIVHQRARG
jgi:4'-phosphopantetheinyl transferase EntD